MRASIEQQLRDDAATDPAFRAALIADPMAAVEERYGVTAPSGLRVRVVEETADEVVLVLPAVDSALSDADLDALMVAGGKGDGGIADRNAQAGSGTLYG